MNNDEIIFYNQLIHNNLKYLSELVNIFCHAILKLFI